MHNHESGSLCFREGPVSGSPGSSASLCWSSLAIAIQPSLRAHNLLTIVFGTSDFVTRPFSPMSLKTFHTLPGSRELLLSHLSLGDLL